MMCARSDITRTPQLLRDLPTRPNSCMSVARPTWPTRPHTGNNNTLKPSPLNLQPTENQIADIFATERFAEDRRLLLVPSGRRHTQTGEGSQAFRYARHALTPGRFGRPENNSVPPRNSRGCPARVDARTPSHAIRADVQTPSHAAAPIALLGMVSSTRLSGKPPGRTQTLLPSIASATENPPPALPPGDRRPRGRRSLWKHRRNMLY